ncbi:hypothetical protein RCO48_27190 [Peribacillus frigoritolerans]|nr:hypothetical protein [Peribacillus frigoritolerans]
MGLTLKLKDNGELLSEAVTNGSVQVPPDGNPIILLSDSQTTGGYPEDSSGDYGGFTNYRSG